AEIDRGQGAWSEGVSREIGISERHAQRQLIRAGAEARDGDSLVCRERVADRPRLAREHSCGRVERQNRVARDRRRGERTYDGNAQASSDEAGRGEMQVGGEAG